MTGILQRVVAAADPAAIVERRRTNWQALHARLAGSPGYCPVFETLPEGICPLCLVIRASQRNTLDAALNEKGIYSYPWGNFYHPSLNPSEFPDMARMRDEILCLPVHQQLTAEQIERIAATARPLLAKYGWFEAG